VVLTYLWHAKMPHMMETGSTRTQNGRSEGKKAEKEKHGLNLDDVRRGTMCSHDCVSNGKDVIMASSVSQSPAAPANCTRRISAFG
jgi:hypothetical protein